MDERALKCLTGDGKIRKLETDGGWLICPVCKRNRRLLRIRPGTTAREIQLYCRSCKSEILVDIDQGECFESRGR